MIKQRGNEVYLRDELIQPNANQKRVKEFLFEIKKLEKKSNSRKKGLTYEIVYPRVHV